VRTAVADKNDVRGKGGALPAVFGEFGLDALGAGQPDGMLAPLHDHNVDRPLLPRRSGNCDACDATRPRNSTNKL